MIIRIPGSRVILRNCHQINSAVERYLLIVWPWILLFAYILYSTIPKLKVSNVLHKLLNEIKERRIRIISTSILGGRIIALFLLIPTTNKIIQYSHSQPIICHIVIWYEQSRSRVIQMKSVSRQIDIAAPTLTAGPGEGWWPEIRGANTPEPLIGQARPMAAQRSPGV